MRYAKHSCNSFLLNVYCVPNIAKPEYERGIKAEIILLITRGGVHEFVHRWGSLAWLAIGADQGISPSPDGADQGRLAGSGEGPQEVGQSWEVGCGSAMTTTKGQLLH